MAILATLGDANDNVRRSAKTSRLIERTIRLPLGDRVPDDYHQSSAVEASVGGPRRRHESVNPDLGEGRILEREEGKALYDGVLPSPGGDGGPEQPAVSLLPSNLTILCVPFVDRSVSFSCADSSWRFKGSAVHGLDAPVLAATMCWLSSPKIESPEGVPPGFRRCEQIP